jgi:hypothetical protein
MHDRRDEEVACEAEAMERWLDDSDTADHEVGSDMGGFSPLQLAVGTKEHTLSFRTDNPARPGSAGSHFYDAGTGRTVVMCAHKSQRLLDVDCPVPRGECQAVRRDG